MRAKSGFTIVELLVVITIIGLLMALLLPAINSARNTAREVQCVNRLKQIGLATIGFSTKKDRFPGYIEELEVKSNSGKTGFNTQIVPWFVTILPELEQNVYYDAIQMGTFDPSTYFDFAVCPSDLPDTQDQPYLSYVVNMGVWDPDVNAALLDGSSWRDEKANGVSHNLVGLLGRYPQLSASAKNRVQRAAKNVRVSTSYISGNDGTATTLLLSENMDAGLWYTKDYVDQGQFGIVWTNPPSNQHRINDKKDLGTVPNVRPEFARPSSQHRGVVIVTFCDGHTESLNEEIDQEVYARLLTPNGAESDIDPTPISISTPPYQRVPLTDSDFAN